jgi:hypothetical protein
MRRRKYISLTAETELRRARIFACLRTRTVFEAGLHELATQIWCGGGIAISSGARVSPVGSFSMGALCDGIASYPWLRTFGATRIAWAELPLTGATGRAEQLDAGLAPGLGLQRF